MKNMRSPKAALTPMDIPKDCAVAAMVTLAYLHQQQCCKASGLLCLHMSPRYSKAMSAVHSCSNRALSYQLYNPALDQRTGCDVA